MYVIADTAVDFLKHYQLVDQAKVDGYARAFVCEDDDYRGNINPRVSDKDTLSSFIYTNTYNNFRNMQL